MPRRAHRPLLTSFWHMRRLGIQSAPNVNGRPTPSFSPTRTKSGSKLAFFHHFRPTEPSHPLKSFRKPFFSIPHPKNRGGGTQNPPQSPPSSGVGGGGKHSIAKYIYIYINIYIFMAIVCFAPPPPTPPVGGLWGGFGYPPPFLGWRIEKNGFWKDLRGWEGSAGRKR